MFMFYNSAESKPLFLVSAFLHLIWTDGYTKKERSSRRFSRRDTSTVLRAPAESLTTVYSFILAEEGWTSWPMWPRMGSKTSLFTFLSVYSFHNFHGNEFNPRGYAIGSTCSFHLTEQNRRIFRSSFRPLLYRPSYTCTPFISYILMLFYSLYLFNLLNFNFLEKPSYTLQNIQEIRSLLWLFTMAMIPLKMYQNAKQLYIQPIFWIILNLSMGNWFIIRVSNYACQIKSALLTYMTRFGLLILSAITSS